MTAKCGSGHRCYLRHYIAAERAVQRDALPVGVHSSAEAAARCRARAET